MMKRFVLCLLVLCLLPVLALGEFSMTVDVNGVLVPLTGSPEVLREADMEDAWTDSVQLIGFCTEDGAEYTVRTGNVSPLVNYFMNDIPDAEELYARLQAALNFSVFHIANIYDADIEIEDAHASKSTKDIKINIAYTFPGEEGTYHGVITMHDSTVVALLTGDCEHHAEALENMKIADEEELAALNTHETIDCDGMYADFSRQTVQVNLDGRDQLMAFLPGYTLVFIDSMDHDASFSQFSEANAKRIMTDKVIPMVAGDDVYDLAYEVLPDGMVHISCATYCSSTLGKQFAKQYGQRFLMCLYANENHVWYVGAADTEEGRAWLDTIRFGEAL